MRNWIVVGILAVLVIVPFLIWGEWFMQIFSEEGAIRILQQYGMWAWAIGLVLLIGDLFLPLPATLIMSALGYLYGPVWGAFLSILGSFLSGLLAYGLCRLSGRKGARWILGEKDLQKGERIFARSGGWIVAVSRWLPVLPEIVACMAGLNQMKAGYFLVALACGSIPLGFIFAYIGHAGVAHPYLALAVSAGLPPVFWAVAQFILRRLMQETLS